MADYAIRLHQALAEIERLKTENQSLRTELDGGELLTDRLELAEAALLEMGEKCQRLDHELALTMADLERAQNMENGELGRAWQAVEECGYDNTWTPELTIRDLYKELKKSGVNAGQWFVRATDLGNEVAKLNRELDHTRQTTVGNSLHQIFKDELTRSQATVAKYGVALTKIAHVEEGPHITRWAREQAVEALKDDPPYYIRWQCPACQHVQDTTPLFKIDCNRGHNWVAMEPYSPKHSTKHKIVSGEPCWCSCGWGYDGKSVVTLPGVSPQAAIDLVKELAGLPPPKADPVEFVRSVGNADTAVPVKSGYNPKGMNDFYKREDIDYGD